VDQTSDRSSRLRDWYNRTSAVLVTQEMMASFDAQNAMRPCPVTRGLRLLRRAFYFRTQLDSFANIRSVTLSKERACVWYPASWGTEAT
jgi:hypothetical protein